MAARWWGTESLIVATSDLSPTVRFYVGDARQVLKTLPAASCDVVLGSVPYLALRSYLPPGHPDKALEMGSEATPGEWCDALLDVVEECRRVLAPHGSLILECGDTMSGSGGAGGDYNADGLRDGQAKFRQVGSREHRPEREGTSADGGDRLVPVAGGNGWPLDKSHAMAPEILRFALAYGFNPLTQRQTPRWRVRNVVRHCRPNPPVGALSDSWRRATSDYLVACVGRKRYFDLDAVRRRSDRTDEAPGGHHRRGDVPSNGKGGGDFANPAKTSPQNPNGAPPLDWFDELDTDRFPTDAWVIPNSGSNLAHYAMFNPAILVPFIECMVPRKVCTVCGEPSRRIVGEPEYVSLRGASGRAMTVGERRGDGVNQFSLPDGSNGSGWARQTATLGWTDCGHDSYRPGVVLDPWAGTGTVGQVAHGHGRSAVLCDLDERNVELARTRLGMFLEVA
jgi:SAM-dependent methyltransferase